MLNDCILLFRYLYKGVERRKDYKRRLRLVLTYINPSEYKVKSILRDAKERFPKIIIINDS